MKSTRIDWMSVLVLGGLLALPNAGFAAKPIKSNLMVPLDLLLRRPRRVRRVWLPCADEDSD
jgi:hypothetical protein